jgi:hypothetical protein
VFAGRVLVDSACFPGKESEAVGVVDYQRRGVVQKTVFLVVSRLGRVGGWATLEWWMPEKGGRDGEKIKEKEKNY